MSNDDYNEDDAPSFAASLIRPPTLREATANLSEVVKQTTIGSGGMGVLSVKPSEETEKDAIKDFRERTRNTPFSNLTDDQILDHVKQEMTNQLKEEPEEIPVEAVNHPPHYNQHPSRIECIEIVRHYNFNIGNVIKYLWRAGLKAEKTKLQDLKKALWYLQDEIDRVEKEEAEKDNHV